MDWCLFITSRIHTAYVFIAELGFDVVKVIALQFLKKNVNIKFNKKR